MESRGVERREVETPKHIWIKTQIGGDSPAPGLLTEWRRLPGGPWEGLVTSARSHRGLVTQFAWQIRTEWVEASRITQV